MVTCLLQSYEAKKLNIVHETFHMFKFAQKKLLTHFWHDCLSCNTNLYQINCSDGLFNAFTMNSFKFDVNCTGCKC